MITRSVFAVQGKTLLLALLIASLAAPTGCGDGGGSETGTDVQGEDGRIRGEGDQRGGGVDTPRGGSDTTPCVPNCVGKECGTDGCGGTCGSCYASNGAVDPSLCEADGTCSDCTPNCANKDCGPDGCGGSCGDCPPGESCVPGNTCVADPVGGDGEACEPCEWDSDCDEGLKCLLYLDYPGYSWCSPACDTDADCGHPGLYCDQGQCGPYWYDTVCDGDLLTAEDGCGNLIEVEECGYELQCWDGQDQCVDCDEAGVSCTISSECCDPLICSPYSKKCMSCGQAGDSCAGYGECCHPYAWCNGNVCEACDAEPGDPCDTYHDCCGEVCGGGICGQIGPSCQTSADCPGGCEGSNPVCCPICVGGSCQMSCS